MGYTENTEADLDNILVYQRPFVRQLLSGRIYVLLGEKRAQLAVGPPIFAV
jgi:hypothetical protein